VKTQELQGKAKQIRQQTFDMVMKAGVGHLGGSFSAMEILIALYYGGVLNVDSQQPKHPGRDRFILSKGHANNTLYVVLADKGFFPASRLADYGVCGFLGNHADKMVPGVEIISGSLGHGLGIGAGLALGAKLSGKDFHTFVLLGDGESQEGSVWEAAMFAAQHRLSRLVAILDRNGLGSEDFTEDTAGLEPVTDKWRSFGWQVLSVDGHDVAAVVQTLTAAKKSESGQPVMVVAKTIKGKGLTVLENKPKAHHTLPKGDEIAISLRDLA
jgi:transketolase